MCLTTVVLKSNFWVQSSSVYHPLKVYPSLVGAVGSVTLNVDFVPVTESTGVPPLDWNVTTGNPWMWMR